MLDAPVFVRGMMVGVVCHEHVGGPRTGSHGKSSSQRSIADFVALALEAAERNVVDAALQQQQQKLELLVAERTEDLTRANHKLQVESAERLAIAARLRASEENLRTVFEVSPVALVVTRMSDQRVLLANRRTAELFEVPEDQVTGQKAPDFYVNPEDRARLVEKVRAEGVVHNYQAPVKTRRGTQFPALISAQALVFDGEPALLVSALDISAQKADEAKLRQLASIDSLTGCYNRGYFRELVAGELERASRYRHAISVAMLDADHFKDVNDTFGHDTGDQVLAAIADCCRRTLRKTDILGRFGEKSLPSSSSRRHFPRRGWSPSESCSKSKSSTSARTAPKSRRRSARVWSSDAMAKGSRRCSAEPTAHFIKPKSAVETASRRASASPTRRACGNRR